MIRCDVLKWSRCSMYDHESGMSKYGRVAIESSGFDLLMLLMLLMLLVVLLVALYLRSEGSKRRREEENLTGLC